MTNDVINFTLYHKLDGTNLELKLVSSGIRLKEELVYHKIMELEESLVKDALVKLGWTPPVKEQDDKN